MDFFDKLRMSGFYYESPNDGGGGKTLEQITNEKLGSGPEGGGEGPADDGGDGAGGSDQPEQPKTKEKESPDDSPESPDGGGGGEEKPDGSGSGADDSADSPDGEDDSPDGEVGDGDGSGEDTPFYDPELHVEGQASHSNKFPTREQAEYAAIQKAQMLREKLDEMEEDGVDRGAIRLPGAIGNNPEELENLTQLERVATMDDDELRSFLNESDGSRQRLDMKHKNAKQEQQAKQYKNEFEKTQGQFFDEVKEVMSVEEIQQNLNKFNDPEQGKQLLQKKIDAKVKEELSDDVKELENWVDKVDEGEIDLSYKEFDEQKRKKVKNIEDKERELREEYGSAVDTYDKLFDLNENIDQTTEMTAEEKRQKRWEAFDGMQRDLGELAIEQTGSPDLDILAETPEARAELVAAKNWAAQNAADYNGLLHESDWREALEKGWPEHKKNVRAGRQADQLKGEEKGGGGSSDDDDIPSPGDQRKLDADGKTVHSRNKSRLDKLEELTRQKVG